MYLRLNSILDNGEAQYQETSLEEIQAISEQANPALVRQNSQLRYSRATQPAAAAALPKSAGLWRYSFHHHSIFARYLGMSLGLSRSLLLFRKHITCEHKFGCLEALLRKAFKTVAVLLLAKGAL